MSSEFTIWVNMRRRCFDPNNQDFHLYGGRGITFSQEWKSFSRFLSDMGERPSKKHSLDRRDVNGNYCKENCYWATTEEQANNRRSNVFRDYRGEQMTLRQALNKAKSGIRLGTAQMRLYKGWTVEQAVETPVGQLPA